MSDNQALPARDRGVAIRKLLEHAERDLDAARTKLQILASLALEPEQESETSTATLGGNEEAP